MKGMSGKKMKFRTTIDFEKEVGVQGFYRGTNLKRVIKEKNRL